MRPPQLQGRFTDECITGSQGRSFALVLISYQVHYLPENPGVLVPPENGWYDTGDIVEVSEDGFVKIVGRAKRFAKVGGEMVSLSAVEDLASRTWPSYLSAAVTVPHETKGEEIVLFTGQPNPSRQELLAQARTLGVSEIGVPKAILERKIPTLGTGKPDYVSLASEAMLVQRAQ